MTDGVLWSFCLFLYFKFKVPAQLSERIFVDM